MNDEPMNSGDRRGPPSRIRIGLDEENHGSSRLVIIAVADPKDEILIADAFRKDGFEIQIAENDLDAVGLQCTNPGGVLITDNFETIKCLIPLSGRGHHPNWKYIAVTADEESAMNYAYEAGADAVLIHPLPEFGTATMRWF